MKAPMKRSFYRNGSGRENHGRRRTMPLMDFACVIVCMTALLNTPDALAQSLSLGGVAGDQPIEVYAQDGIEWQQDGNLFVARGDARAVRGEVEVLSDELRAHYRETASGQSEVWRLDALGNVRIVSNSETAYGDRAIYNADQKVLVVDGKSPRLVSGQDTLSASQQLEYWELKKYAVARGDAVASRDKKKVFADVLVAHLRPDDKGNTRVYRVDAYDNVRIRTERETATGDRGVYNVESGIATLTGRVRLVRDDNVLRGCRAQVNLNTGISQLFACSSDQGTGRVQGSFIPKNRSNN
ncbi:LptA/OstA family protein [Thalassospiraceae bacterium LMO-JJ14]|nr:LptA/OstA family protein [Thalassospiraceae bacterium LMO-JJ14]